MPLAINPNPYQNPVYQTPSPAPRPLTSPRLKKRGTREILPLNDLKKMEAIGNLFKGISEKAGWDKKAADLLGKATNEAQAKKDNQDNKS